jgi:hypothetical protein
VMRLAGRLALLLSLGWALLWSGVWLAAPMHTAGGLDALPTWPGIVVGQTSKPEAVIRLQAQGWTVETGCVPNGLSDCLELIQLESLRMLYLYSDQGTVFQLALLSPGITMGEVLAFLGQPTSVTYNNNSGQYRQFWLWYADPGIEVTVATPCMTDVARLLRQSIPVLSFVVPAEVSPVTHYTRVAPPTGDTLTLIYSRIKQRCAP